MSTFEIRRSNSGAKTISGILPAVALPVGKALMRGSVDADTEQVTFVLASGRADGFLARASRVPDDGLNGNPRTAEEQLMGFGLETPFTAGREGSLDQADVLVVEGDDYIMSSGTGAVDTNTAVETKLSFKEGRLYAAQTGDYAQFRLAKQLTPETEGNTRIRVEKIDGYLVP